MYIYIYIYIRVIKNTLSAGVHRNNVTAPSLRPAYANLRLLMFLHFEKKSLRESLREAYANPTRTDVFEK